MQNLFFKELRENRMLPVSFALLLCLVMAALRVLNPASAESTPAILYAIWMFAALFSGAGLISREVGSGSLQFLMALPVSRSRVWLMKAAAGLVLTMLCMVSTAVVWMAAQEVLFSPQAFSTNTLSSLSSAGWVALTMFSCYCGSLAISTLLDRSISAAMVSILTTAAMSIPLAYGSSLYSVYPFPQVHPTETISLAALALAPGFLLASYWAFRRGESLRTGRRFSFAAGGCLLGLVFGWTILLGASAFLGRFHRFGNQMTEAMLSPDGQWVVVSAMDGRPGDRGHSRVYDSAEYRARHLVVERAASANQDPDRHVWPGDKALDWSPDGRYLVFSATTGPLGLNSTEVNLMVGDVLRGTADRVPWAPRTWGNDVLYSVKWSPDSQWLAIDDPTQSDVQFISRADIISRHGDLARRRFSTQAGPSPNFETQAEQRSRRFSMVQSGNPSQQLFQPGQMQRGWSADSRFFYTLRTSVLVAIDPSKAPPATGQSTQPDGPRSVYSKGAYPLCAIPPYGNLQLETTADPHRTLATLLIGSGTLAYDKLGEKPAPWKSQIQAIIDLPAATEAALRRDPDEPSPAVETWLRQWTSHSMPASCAGGSLSISPDGRYLALRQHDPLDPPRRAHDVSSTLLLSVDGDISHPASSGPSAGTRSWLPGGHRYSITDSSNVLRTIDAETRASQSYPLGDGKLLGIAAGEHLLLTPATINDAFSPLESPISITVGHPGEK